MRIREVRVTPFDYNNSGYRVRPDLPEAYREIWREIGVPGNCWTGAQRIAILAEARATK